MGTVNNTHREVNDNTAKKGADTWRLEAMLAEPLTRRVCDSYYCFYIITVL